MFAIVYRYVLFTDLKEVVGRLGKATRLNSWREPPHHTTALQREYLLAYVATWMRRDTHILLFLETGRSEELAVVSPLMGVYSPNRNPSIFKLLDLPQRATEHSAANHFKRCPPPPPPPAADGGQLRRRNA